MGMVIYDSCEICGEVKCDYYCLNTAYDRLEILLKVALNTKNQIKSECV
jgi:hypothetical protein